MFGRKQENILVIKTDGLAAFVAAEPVFDAVRQANPNAKISLLTDSGLQRIARASPYFDQVAAMPNFRDVESRKAFVKQLKVAKFARVYDLSADENARKLHAAMGPLRPKWHSAEAAPKKRNRKGAAPEARLPGFDAFLAEARLARPERLPDMRWALSARKDSANMQPAWFGVAGAFGLLLPGADPERRWPAANYAALSKIMSRERLMPVMVGGKDLHAFGDEVAHEAPEIVDLSGKTDHLQLAALAQEAAFFVTDSGEEAYLAMSVGCAGVFIRRPGEPAIATEGRNVVMLTAPGGLGEAGGDFVWRTLRNMGLIPDARAPQRAAAR